MNVKSNLNFLNLGCGSRFHPDWTNLDFNSSSKNVIKHNLLKGIPFPDKSFDVVYHSHVLEHFSKSFAVLFIKECYRVLKPNGIIRIAIPDLEKITQIYLQKLDDAQNGSMEAEADYDWITLELYDQTVREYPGGAMLKMMTKNNLPNIDFIKSRMGAEFIELGNKNNSGCNTPFLSRKFLGKTKRAVINAIYSILSLTSFGKDLKTGNFRRSGEIHQWMYDRFSLKRLLEKNEFKYVSVSSPFESRIEKWEEFELDSKNGIVHKPDSLFIEATK